MRKTWRVAAVVGLVILGTGCMTTPDGEGELALGSESEVRQAGLPRVAEIEEADRAMLKAIRDSVERISRSQRILAETANAQARAQMDEEEIEAYAHSSSRTPAGLDEPVQMTGGPLTDLIAHIARLTGYDFPGPYGDKPDEDIFVNLHDQREPRPAIDVLRDLGARVQGRAVIRVHPKRGEQRIELEYRDRSREVRW